MTHLASQVGTVTTAAPAAPGRQPHTVAGSVVAGEQLPEQQVSDVAELLRATPLHRWAALRERGDAGQEAVFDAAVARVHIGWSCDEHGAQVRDALTVAATEIVLALPSWTGGEQVDVTRLRNARAALTAVEMLLANGRVPGPAA